MLSRTIFGEIFLKMIRKAILIVVLTLFNLGGFAQEQEEKNKNKISFGLSGGVNLGFLGSPIGELGNNKALDYNSYFRLGMNLNAKVYYRVNDYLRLQSGISYQGRGTEYRRKNNNVLIINTGGGSEGAYHKTRYRLDYVDIPVVLGVNLRKLFKDPDFDYKPIHFNVGFSAGFLTKSDIKSNYYASHGGSSGPFVEVNEDFREREFDHGKSFVPNMILGVSFVHYEQEDFQLTIDVNYQQSFGGVNKGAILTESEYNYDTNTSVLGISFGINFN
ncbi:OMP_b-brl_2 domain-containing protein [Tenacibaculum sp. 190524A02b]